LEGRALLFSILTVLAVVVGGAVQILPSILIAPSPEVASQTRLPTALERLNADPERTFWQ
jgi:hypothetical protein